MWLTARTTASGSCSATRCWCSTTSATAAAIRASSTRRTTCRLDSKGNIYTVETYTGARLQKFAYKGLGAVAKPEGNHN